MNSLIEENVVFNQELEMTKIEYNIYWKIYENCNEIIVILFRLYIKYLNKSHNSILLTNCKLD